MRSSRWRCLVGVSALLGLAGCGGHDLSGDAGLDDAGLTDGGTDAGKPDGGATDAGHTDAGADAGQPDAGHSDGGPDGGAGADAGPTDAGRPDAGPFDAGTPRASDGGCNIGNPPVFLPLLAGQFWFNDPDAGTTPPVALGGDPTGNWVGETFTIYLPSAVSTFVNASQSTASGHVWARVHNGFYFLSVDYVFSLATLTGPVGRPDDFTSRGTFTTVGSQFVNAPDCQTIASTYLRDIHFSHPGIDGGFLLEVTIAQPPPLTLEAVMVFDLVPEP